MKKETNIITEIPAEAIEKLARCLLPEIQKYFESEEGKREFEEWKLKNANQAVKAA
ncbi:MAG: hypothetical protein LBC86_03925 [Oscillospiraceae bacterium]|nr:hypothetical protein [Oscillospiraceae bacterium]